MAVGLPCTSKRTFVFCACAQAAGLACALDCRSWALSRKELDFSPPHQFSFFFWNSVSSTLWSWRCQSVPEREIGLCSWKISFEHTIWLLSVPRIHTVVPLSKHSRGVLWGGAQFLLLVLHDGNCIICRKFCSRHSPPCCIIVIVLIIIIIICPRRLWSCFPLLLNGLVKSLSRKPNAMGEDGDESLVQKS